jgi:hypothetical protein
LWEHPYRTLEHAVSTLDASAGRLKGACAGDWVSFRARVGSANRRARELEDLHSSIF